MEVISLKVITSIKYAAINTFLHVLVSPGENFVILRTKTMINLNGYTPIILRIMQILIIQKRNHVRA